MADEKKTESKVTVDDDICIGCGACISEAPQCFEFNESGKSVVKDCCSDGCKDIEAAKKAADECPVDAIDIK